MTFQVQLLPAVGVPITQAAIVGGGYNGLNGRSLGRIAQAILRRGEALFCAPPYKMDPRPTNLRAAKLPSTRAARCAHADATLSDLVAPISFYQYEPSAARPNFCEKITLFAIKHREERAREAAAPALGTL